MGVLTKRATVYSGLSKSVTAAKCIAADSRPDLPVITGYASAGMKAQLPRLKLLTTIKGHFHVT